ncbi:MAG: amidohydrolase [Chloroflexi bacterium]|nr:amidohydrolase [Chloroflexota bacterium]
MIVDIHNHIIPPALIDAFKREQFDGFSAADRANGVTVRLRDHGSWELPPERWDLDLRIRDMDAMGVEIQAISLTPQLQAYHLPLEQANRLCHLVNEAIAEMAASHPTRFHPLGIVPLQHPEAAVRELRRLRDELGYTGVEIMTNVEGADLGEDRFLPFWEAVAGLGIFVFAHPVSDSLAKATKRMGSYHLSNLIGNPLDSSLSMGNLIFGGHLERWPNLKICFCHAGGLVPYQIGRFDHAYNVRTDGREHISNPPSYYFKKLYFDTISHGVPALQYLLSLVGPDQLILGTDYPADMADIHPLDTVAGLDLSPEDHANVVGGTAARLLGIKRGE